MIIVFFLLFYVLSFVLLYVIRSYLASNKLFSGDTFFHLAISRSIRENKWKYPLSLKNVIFFESDKRYNYLTYPPLLHYITALFPVRYHLTIAKNLNLVILSLLGSLTAIITYNLTLNLIFAILSCLIVIVNLSAFDLITQFSPRPLGIFFYSIIIYITIFCPLDWFFLLLISLLVALASLAHKFSLQALILGLVPYMIIFNKPILGFSFLFGLVISILISRGFYLKILKEHFFWLRFYNFKRKILFKHDLSYILVRNPWYIVIFAIIFLIIGNNLIFLNAGINAKIFFWAIVNLLVAIVVLIPALSLIGEYYRYIEYSLVPVGIAIGLFLNSSNYLVIAALFVALFISFVALLRLKKSIENSKMIVNPSDIQLYQTLKEYCNTNLMIIPSIRTLEINYFTQLNVIHLVRGHGILGYLAQIIEAYKVGYILKFKGVDSYALFEGIRNLRNLEKIKDFENFELYSIRQKLN